MGGLGRAGVDGLALGGMLILLQSPEERFTQLYLFNMGKDAMRKQIGSMVAVALALSLGACGGQGVAEQKAESGTVVETETTEATEASVEGSETDSAGVTQEEIEQNIVGTWIKSEIGGHHVLTNDKSVLDIVSTTEAYASASHRSDEGAPFDYHLKSTVDINGNVVTITTTNAKGDTNVHELTITSINDSEFTADRKFTRTSEGPDALLKEETLTYTKVNDEYSDEIVGTWEGHSTSEGVASDDGQDHRWEYRDDGTYTYYVKDGDDWVGSDNTLNDYFVAQNLLCTRWVDGDEEFHESWEITIDGDTMSWSALREGEDGKTFTPTFEMKRVEE